MKETIKAIPNSFRNLVIALLATSFVFAFFGCKSETETADTTAPSEVISLNSTEQNTAVLLTWTDPSDEDLFGIEIICTAGTKTSDRAAISAMERESVFIAPGTQNALISNLENGTEYTFTVKTMDTSGNKSEGITAQAMPKAGNPLEISLSAAVPHENDYTGSKSNTTVTVSVNITTANNVKKVVYKKAGSSIAKRLLADNDAKDCTKDTSDDKKWTFVISATDETANGLYAVAAIDEAGREEAEQIRINNFDFTAPAKVTDIDGKYEAGVIELSWTNPTDDDFDKIEITYTSSKDGLIYDSERVTKSVQKEKTNETFDNIDDSNATYKFEFVSIDELGNRSEPISYEVTVNKSLRKIPEGFVDVSGGTFDGKKTLTPNSEVFISGREIKIRNLYVSDHEVTQKEYETYCKYGKDAPSDTYGKGDNYPAYYVNWYDAIVYCNLRSIAEGLTPAYKLDGETDPKSWTGIQGSETEKYCGPQSSASRDQKWDKLTFDTEANGYRLPTEAEWEYLARGGNKDNYNYSGSNTIGDVAWFKENSGGKIHEIRGKKANSLKLYDMNGNVREWCWDWIENGISKDTPATGVVPKSRYRRVMRGGYFLSDTSNINITVYLRSEGEPYDRSNDCGFRVVRNANSR